ncbi:MAG: thermonuclease family protein [Thiothrix sp.]|uniref:thermonuclease family protein n=1 Tax=Thiothrix sp. TaxID=1032 RepID=UPI0026277075|nr:thermonuclease family protein [Thiothrix sp.]MDD5395350.1 thermonuclease family protein [Thiothrix sp.]
MYEYTAIVREVYDGDTVTVDVDLGLCTWLHGQKLRLYGINAPEMRGEQRAAGTVTRDWLRSQILGKTVTIKTYKDQTEKYGRWLADVWAEGQRVSVNEQMVNNGLAVSYLP